MFGGSAAREVLVLVAGILIAFGLDTWWDDRAETREVRVELGNVVAELQENRHRLDRYLAWHTRAADASAAFVELLRSAQTPIVQVPDSIVWGTYFTPSFDPRTGAIDALLSSGRLALVDEPALRSAIAGFNGYLRDARDEELRARSYVDMQLASILHESGNVARPIGSFEWRDSGGPPNGSNLYTAVRASTELLNHLARRHLFAFLSIESLQSVQVQIDSLATMIGSTLGAER